MTIIRRHFRVRACASLVGLLALGLVLSAQVKNPQRMMNTDPELRLKMYDQHLALKAESKFKDLKWQFLGPVNISGRTSARTRAST
jgi:hypothetical protein